MLSSDENRKAAEFIATDTFNYLKLAHEYNWSWFQYHASQRMHVFRFYFLVIAAIIAGYANTFRAEKVIAATIAAMAPVVSYLFWRLDVRSRDLVNVTTAFLKASENVLASRLDVKTIKLAHTAESQREGKVGVYSFGQAISTFYAVISVLGFLGFVYVLLSVPTSRQAAINSALERISK